jgi:hypothetical protein
MPALPHAADVNSPCPSKPTTLLDDNKVPYVIFCEKIDGQAHSFLQVSGADGTE